MGRITDKMQREFDEHRNGIESFISTNSGCFDNSGTAAYIAGRLENVNRKRKEKGMGKLTRRQIADLGNLNEALVYSFFSGERPNLGRDNAIKLCFGMGLDCDEADHLLGKVGKSKLYIRNERDCVIMYFLRQFSDKNAESRLLTECNIKLKSLGIEEL